MRETRIPLAKDSIPGAQDALNFSAADFPKLKPCNDLQPSNLQIFSNLSAARGSILARPAVFPHSAFRTPHSTSLSLKPHRDPITRADESLEHQGVYAVLQKSHGAITDGHIDSARMKGERFIVRSAIVEAPRSDFRAAEWIGMIIDACHAIALRHRGVAGTGYAIGNRIGIRPGINAAAVGNQRAATALGLNWIHGIGNRAIARRKCSDFRDDWM